MYNIVLLSVEEFTIQLAALFHSLKIDHNRHIVCLCMQVSCYIADFFVVTVQSDKYNMYGY